MYQIVKLEDEISVPPRKFDKDLNKAIKESIAEKFEGRLDNDIGVILGITKINEIGEGKILPGDPSVHYLVRFDVLTWMPLLQEIVEGEIIDITEFGAFVRAGALDGLVHVSQIMDDYVSYDEKNSQLVGKQSRRVLKEKDKVRARIISVSFKEQSKVGLTMRQPFLGSLNWIYQKPEKKRIEKKKK